MSIAYAASIGGLLTPVGSPPNLITIGLLETATGTRIDFLRWMLFAAPLTALLGVGMFALVRWRFPSPAATRLVERDATPRRARAVDPRSAQLRVRVRRGRGAVARCPAWWRWWRPIHRRASCSRRASTRPWSPCFAATLLFLLPTDWSRRTFTIEWRQAARIDWGTLLLFGGGLSLGGLMFESGLAKVIGTGLAETLGAESRVAVVALAAALGVLLSELTSNTAATNMVVPVVISLAQARGLDPTLPAIAACFGASLGFMLPISTPPNAIVYGTGMIPIGRMFSTGVLLDLLGLIVVIAGLLVLAPSWSRRGRADSGAAAVLRLRLDRPRCASETRRR